jgi:hypothetical protein
MMTPVAALLWLRPVPPAPQGLESSIEPPELGGGSEGSLSALKPCRNSRKKRGIDEVSVDPHQR